jgi:nitroreductase
MARDAISVLKTLRAVRQFTDQPLPPDAVRDNFDVIRWSGNASNRQQFEVLWVEDRELLRDLARCEGHAGHLEGAAAGVVIVTWMARDELNAFDEGRLAERIMLAAHAHGLGSSIGWLAGQGREEAKRLLEVSAERTVRTAVSIGHPAPGASRGGRRRPLDEAVRRVP